MRIKELGSIKYTELDEWYDLTYRIDGYNGMLNNGKYCKTIVRLDMKEKTINKDGVELYPEYKASLYLDKDNCLITYSLSHPTMCECVVDYICGNIPKGTRIEIESN